MAKVPSAVWIVDTKKEHLAVDEAKKLHIPIVAILDTNCDPDEVDYRIPGNDDAIRSVTLLTRVIADAVAEGLMARSGAREAGAEQVGADEPLAEWERELLEGAKAQTGGTEGAKAETAAEAAPVEAAAGQEAQAAAEQADAAPPPRPRPPRPPRPPRLPAAEAPAAERRGPGCRGPRCRGRRRRGSRRRGRRPGPGRRSGRRGRSGGRAGRGRQGLRQHPIPSARALVTRGRARPHEHER